MEDNAILKGVAWVGITASCFRLSFRSRRLLDMRIVSLLELTSAGQQIDRDDKGEQDVDGGEQDGLHCRDNQLREQEEAARKHQSHENDSCENSSGRDGYVDEVDGLGGLNGLGIGIDSLIHNAAS